MPEFAVDSSVIVGILNREPNFEVHETLLQSSFWYLGWATLFETRIWMIQNRTETRASLLDAMLTDNNVTMVDFSGDLESIASSAYSRFGKGRHPAQLNYGDCMAYAVAKFHHLPLLFKGGDFGRTDVDIHPASIVSA